MNGYYAVEELKELGLKSVGENVLISRKASIYCPGQISIGHDVRIDDFCFLVGNITIGNYVHLAPYASVHGTGGGSVTFMDFTALGSYSTIYAGIDDFSGEVMGGPMVDVEFRKEIYSDIVLEKYAAVGLHSLLLPGAYLAEGCVMGAMSTLLRSTEPWGIYLGVPVRRIKERSRRIMELEARFIAKRAKVYG